MTANENTAFDKRQKHLMQIAENEENMQKRVKIRLHRDGYRNREPLYVSVNGYSARIPRGVEVMIPLFAAEAIRESLAQDELTLTKMENLEREYSEAEGI